MQIISYDQVKSKIIEIRDQKTILDSDVAELYGVETKRINEAVKNNPNKFPNDYILSLNESEWLEVRSKISTSPLGGGRAYKPKAFTERGLYMLATILKSPRAVATTLAIIDTFAKVKELDSVIHQIQTTPDNSPKQQALMEHTGNLIADLIIPEDNLEVTGTETTYEMNFALFKIKRTVKKGK